MKNIKLIALVGVAATATLAMAGCSSSNSGSSGSASIAGASCQSGAIKSSGSSAQKNAITQWINSYQQACTDATIDYQANGSGAGIQDFINGQTAFAGSDSAIKDADLTSASQRCAKGPAINLPMVGGAIVGAYNISGVSNLTLTPAVLAGIYANQITKWNDKAITGINPGVNLPDASIVQFHRSDSSGTTDNFTQYLSANAPNVWKFTAGKDWVAPGGQGAKGNDGVASSVKSTANSIGYIELSFAQDQNLNLASIDNGSGPVAPSAQTASVALAQAQVIGTGNNLVLKLDYSTKQAGAYPLVLITYEITCQSGLPSDQLGLTKAFLTYTVSSDAQGELSSIGYAPIPADLLTKVTTAVNAIS